MAIVTLMLTSCLKNDIVYNTDDLDFRTWEFAGPLAKIHVPLMESMKKHFQFKGSFIEKGGVICLEYNHSQSVKWNDEIGLDNSYQLEYSIIPMNPVNSKFKAKISESVRMRIKEAENADDTYVSKAEFTGGSLFMTLRVPVACDIELTIPGLTLDDEPFSVSLKNLSPGTKYEILKSNLNGYIIDIPSHALDIECEIFAASNATGQKIEISFKLEDTKLSYLSGYFGTVKKTINGEMNFDFFEKMNFEGVIGFQKGIEVKAQVTNGTGIPFQIKTNDIKFDRIDGGFDMEEESVLNVPAATEDKNHVVSPVTTQPVVFAKFGNLNFIDYPSKIMYEVGGTANPDPGPVENFIAKNGNDLTKADLTIIVPLNINLKKFNRNDSVNFDYKNLLNEDKELHESVKDFVLNLVVNNNLPFNIKLSAFVIDEKDKPVGDNILNETQIKANSNKQEIKIDLQNRLNDFWSNNVKHIVIHTQAETSGDQYMPVKVSDYLDISVSARFKSNIPNNLFE